MRAMAFERSACDVRGPGGLAAEVGSRRVPRSWDLPRR